MYNILGILYSEDIRVKITKLILWIAALVLIVALGFFVISIAVKGKTGGSSKITTKHVKDTQRFTDGLPSKDIFKYETKISKEGTYSITFEPDISPATCVIGSEVYDSDGKLLGAAILYDEEDYSASYEFTEGTCSFMFRYITTEQDFRDFIQEYDASYGASSIRKALEKVDFSKFKENGKVTVNCKLTIGTGRGTGYNFVDLGVLTFIGVSLLAVLIVLGVIYKQKKPAEPEVYDGVAPEVPPVPAKPAPAPQQTPYGYPQPAYQYQAQGIWTCSACGDNSNTGRFCANCGQPRPAYAQPVQQYQVPAYQLPAYTVSRYPQYQPYQAPAYQVPAYAAPQYQQYPAQAYQITYQTAQPVQYAQPVFAPVPVQQPVFAPAPVQKPDYSVKPKPAPEPADPAFVEGMKNRIPAVGAKYAAFCVVFLMIQFAVALLLRLTVPDVVKAYKTSISYGLVVLAVDLIGFPFIWLLMKGIPKTKIEQHKLSFPEWFGFLCMTEGLMIAGSLIGNPIHTALTQPFTGDSVTNASNLMENSNVILRTLVVGIGAPVFEELIFRKVLIDRTIKYGEYISIVMSGVMFGLLHGNFSQFFFATFVGMLFAYVYIRTGRIRYTIFLHMAVNLSSALVLQTLLQKLLSANSTGDTDSPEILVYAMIALAWIGGVFAIAIIGIVKLIKSLKRKRLKLKMMKGEPTHKEVRKLLLSDKALWLYLAMTILLFLDSYLPNIIVFVMGRLK